MDIGEELVRKWVLLDRRLKFQQLKKLHCFPQQPDHLWQALPGVWFSPHLTAALYPHPPKLNIQDIFKYIWFIHNQLFYMQHMGITEWKCGTNLRPSSFSSSIDCLQPCTAALFVSNLVQVGHCSLMGQTN